MNYSCETPSDAFECRGQGDRPPVYQAKATDLQCIRLTVQCHPSRLNDQCAVGNVTGQPCDRQSTSRVSAQTSKRLTIQLVACLRNEVRLPMTHPAERS